MSALRCPTCGNDGTTSTIRYLVDGVSRAIILALREGGVLELAGPAASSRRRERPKLECWAIRADQRICFTRWELPASITGVAWRVAS
jgi:hypothetical protein